MGIIGQHAVDGISYCRVPISGSVDFAVDVIQTEVLCCILFIRVDSQIRQRNLNQAGLSLSAGNFQRCGLQGIVDHLVLAGQTISGVLLSSC